MNKGLYPHVIQFSYFKINVWSYERCDVYIHWAQESMSLTIVSFQSDRVVWYHWAREWEPVSFFNDEFSPKIKDKIVFD